MQRRAFLKRGILGGMLLAVGGGAGLALWPHAQTFAPKKALRVVDARGFAVLAAIASRVVPFEGADPVEIAHVTDEMLMVAYPESKTDLRRLLGLFESALAGLILDGRARPFTQLSPSQQDEALVAWRDSRLVLRRGAYGLLRKIVLAAHYQTPSSWAGVGYAGPPEIAG